MKVKQILLAILASWLQKKNTILIFDIFKTCNDTYEDFYEDSRDAYVSFVNFAPSVKSQMHEVDKQLQL